jgi:hypothetical protein
MLTVNLIRDFIPVPVPLKKTNTKGVVEFIANKQLTTPNWPLTNPTCSFNRDSLWSPNRNQSAIDERGGTCITSSPAFPFTYMISRGEWLPGGPGDRLVAAAQQS